jgi:hypothetical protein
VEHPAAVMTHQEGRCAMIQSVIHVPLINSMENHISVERELNLALELATMATITPVVRLEPSFKREKNQS